MSYMFKFDDEVNKVCDKILELGFIEFKTYKKNIRSFSGPGLEGPYCDCNSKPPPFHVHVPAKMIDSNNTPLIINLEIDTFGEKNGFWCNQSIYSIIPEQFFNNWGILHEKLSKMWQAFCESE